MNDPRAVAASSPASPVRIKPSTSKSIFKIILAITAILVALLLGLIVLLLIGVETGPIALMIGLISATLPVPLYLMLDLWIDRYEAETLWMMASMEPWTSALMMSLSSWTSPLDIIW